MVSNEQLKIETLSEAKQRNRIKIEVLRASEDYKLHRLADKLERCRKGKRCHLLACSVCLRRFRLCYLKEHLPIWKKLMKQKNVRGAT